MTDGVTTAPLMATAPIGIFDSGVGGLSVLRHIREHLPSEALVYFSDARFAPYGSMPSTHIEARALAIGDYLMRRGVKAIVVACNTATAVAIAALRAAWPALIVIGVEPGLKPAAALTATKLVGVLATEVTLASARFEHLRQHVATEAGVQFLLQACPGLVEQIEAGALRCDATDALLRRFIVPLLVQGADTLVLGCTHYPFLLERIEAIATATAGPCRQVAVIDTGAAVARQLERLLTARGAWNAGGKGTLEGVTSGATEALAMACTNLLQTRISVTQWH